MEHLQTTLAGWFGTPWAGPAIAALFALICLTIGLTIRRGQRRYERSAKRLEHTRGVVRKAELHQWQTNTGGSRSAFHLEVDFQVGNTAYCCTRFELYGDAPHPSREKEAATLQPGEGVRVWYDRLDPKISALVVGRPFYFGTYYYAAIAVLFLAVAVYMGLQVIGAR